MTSKETTVVIIGAGKMGQIIANCVRPRAKAVHFWDIDSSKIVGELPLEETLPKASVVFLCVPSFGLRFAAEKAIPLLNRKAAFITVAKGVEETSGLTMAELLQKLLRKHRHSFALLSGPMLADEFSNGMPGFGVLGGLDKAAYNNVSKLFTGSALKLSYSSDVFGVAYAGVLKNIYAIGLGILSGQKSGKNVQGWYVTEAMAEMRGILSRLNAHANTAESWAGLGDLVATGFSPSSRNFSAGVAIAQGDFKTSSEGTRSIPIICKKLGRSYKKFTLLTKLHTIVVRKKQTPLLY